MSSDTSSKDCVLLRLQTNRMVYDIMHPYILRSAMDGVIQSFGGIKSMIEFITGHSNIDELKSIHNVIKKTKIELQNDFHDSHSDEIQNNDDDDDDMKENNNNFFEALPNECIHHISNYLTKKNVRSFKLSSRQIAVICLQQMDRITVGVLPYHVFTCNNIDLYHFNMNTKSYKTRHVATKRFDSLFEEWSKYYQIPQENQFIFSQRSYDNKLLMHDLSTMRISKVNTNSYLLCDSKKIVILNDEEARLFDAKQDKIDDLRRNYNLMVLEYFDIMKQSLQIVQLILYKDNVSRTRLFWYIEHGFIKNEAIDNEWYNELIHCLKQMCIDQENPKLCIFNHAAYTMQKIRGDNLTKTLVISDAFSYPNFNSIPSVSYDTDTFNFYTFQLNYNHEWFKKTNKFDKSMFEYEQRMEKFEFEANKFCINNQKIGVEIKNDTKMLRSCIDKYYKVRLNKEEKRIYKADINAIRKMINNERIEIRINTSLSIFVLKQKIAKVFDGIFDPKNIELCRDNKVLHNDQPIVSTSIDCYFVVYDTNDVTSIPPILFTNSKVYKVYIFDPLRCPHPFYDGNNATMMMRVRYSVVFAFKDLAQFVFDLIYKATDNALYPQYKHLVDLFYGDDGMEEDNDCDLLQSTISKRKISDSIKCVFGAHNCYYRKNQIFSLFDSNVTDVSEFDLFLIRNKQSSIKCDRKLAIKFVLQEKQRRYRWRWQYHGGKSVLNIKTKINELDNLKYIGLPLTIWINPNDTLQDIIDKYLNDNKEYIESCWRVKVNDKFIKLQPKTWDNYQPWYRFMWNCCNDFIIIQVKNHKEYKIQEPEYDTQKITEIFNMSNDEEEQNKMQEIFKLFNQWDQMDDEEEAHKMTIAHLLTKQQLNPQNVRQLNLRQKEELQRGIQCLDSNHFDPIINILQSFIPDEEEDDEVELDIDSIDNPTQIKMYNCMLQAIHEQEQERIQRQSDEENMLLTLKLLENFAQNQN